MKKKTDHRTRKAYLRACRQGTQPKGACNFKVGPKKRKKNSRRPYH